MSTSEKNSIKEHYGSHDQLLSQHSLIKLQYAKKCSDIRTSNLTQNTLYKTSNENSIKDLHCNIKKGML